MGRGRGKNFKVSNKYLNKRESRELIEVEQPQTVEEAIITHFLTEEAVKVLEATGKGYFVNHLASARELIKLLS